jgi:glycerophosphoryl diester phosphodiesterase
LRILKFQVISAGKRGLSPFFKIPSPGGAGTLNPQPIKSDQRIKIFTGKFKEAGMKLRNWLMFLPLFSVMNLPGGALAGGKKIVIAHRGACGYLPEHTLEAVALAYAMGADFIEQDVVMTKDNRLVVLHDIHIDAVTNAAEVFPNRARRDGRFYAIDFTLAELKTLYIHERVDVDTKAPVFPRRFPVNAVSQFQIPTLEEEIEMIQALNQSTGKNVGIYVEMKAPAWHQKEGKDLSQAVLETLARYGYRDETANVYLQCFDPAELKRLRFELKTPLPLVQLIGENSWGEAEADYEAMRTPEGIAKVAEYANGIGPKLDHIVSGLDENGQPVVSSLMQSARRHNLVVHPYTFRADQLPPQVPDFETLLKMFFFHIGVDGVFTDFPDKAVKVLREQKDEG